MIAVDQIAVDLPEVVEIDINPLLADPDGVIALDARIVLGHVDNDRLAIRSYPRDLEETMTFEGLGDVRVRPICPEDKPGYHEFISRLSPENIRMRFFR